MPDEIKLHRLSSLQAELECAVLDDVLSRCYVTDASIYQMMPHAVVIPETLDDVRQTLAFARREGIAIFSAWRWHISCVQTVNHVNRHRHQQASEPDHRS